MGGLRRVRATRNGWAVCERCHVCGGDGAHVADLEPNRLHVADCICDDGWRIVSEHRTLISALLARHDIEKEEG